MRLSRIFAGHGPILHSFCGNSELVSRWRLPQSSTGFAGCRGGRGALQSGKARLRGLVKATQALCPICGGIGWKEIGNDNLRQVARCDCALSGRVQRLITQARIPARYEHCDFSDFNTDFRGADGSLEVAKLIAQKFAAGYPLENDGRGLLFVGAVGVGKTHLAAAVLKELLRKGIPCLFCDYRDLLKQVQNSYNPSVQITEMELLRPIFETEVVLLDELGAVKPTDWVWDTVSHILNTRYNDKRTTVITTNFPDLPPAPTRADNEPIDRFKTKRAAREETLGDRIGERMWSRLHEMCKKVEITGQDFRQSVKSASFR
jgi:DNA replication protein DnaC